MTTAGLSANGVMRASVIVRNACVVKEAILPLMTCGSVAFDWWQATR